MCWAKRGLTTQNLAVCAWGVQVSRNLPVGVPDVVWRKNYGADAGGEHLSPEEAVKGENDWMSQKKWSLVTQQENKEEEGERKVSDGVLG